MIHQNNLISYFISFKKLFILVIHKIIQLQILFFNLLINRQKKDKCIYLFLLNEIKLIRWVEYVESQI